MWSAGELSIDSLSGYSKEYFQLVKAVPSYFEKVASQANDSDASTLQSHQIEEVEHIKPWIKFSGALGISEGELTKYSGLKKTRDAVLAISSLLTSIGNGAAALYSLEKPIPEISQKKLDGLKDFYDMTSDDATEYFKIHTEVDIKHAASWRDILERNSLDNSDDLFQIAEKSISAQHLLLDACC